MYLLASRKQTKEFQAQRFHPVHWQCQGHLQTPGVLHLCVIPQVGVVLFYMGWSQGGHSIT